MLVYVAPITTAFIQRDLEMLREKTEVRFLTFTDRPLLLPFFFLFQFLQLGFLLPFTDQYLCFFGGYHTVIPVIFGKLFGKRVIIQCGGTDAMHLPQIDYGNYRKKWLKKATVFSFRNCSLIVPVSASLVVSDYRYDTSAPEKQGLKNLIPDLATPIQVVHNGFDAEFWSDPGGARRDFSFITVATGISTTNRAKVKGIDLILEAAKKYKDFHFTLVGDATFHTVLPNVTVAPKMNKEELRGYYQQHRFYLQLSASEGFPNALAEAMLCGCIPIGSKVGEIEHIIGKTGFILEKRDFGLLCAILDKLPGEANLNELRRKARERIAVNFSYALRKKKLLGIIDQTGSADGLP